ncbi:MAG TPA: GGDEF domain-containing protein, partial [Gammaproteobacteria bacterium]|nr:GGDEF domain-containing protein [Gammaproteobacteria bacterium]
DARELFLTASVGIGVYPADGLDAGTLLKHADTALYRAKEKGRNTYQFFKAEMTAKALERLSLETQLRRALERDEFCLHYQPQVSVASGRIVGVEALLRWEHPALGVVSPLDFIPLLEETGLIVPVGEWVLRSACQQARRWWAEGVCPFSVAVNVSPLQLKSPALLPLVEDLAGDCGEAPAGCHLELEITESLLMEQARESALQLEALSALGVGIALDDFGTGYSSLSYLKRFPIDKVKIDRAFIDEVSSDPGDAAIATAIIAMAHTLNKEVVAEGVENEDQLAFLRARGCDKWQGFLKSRAVPATAVTTMLAAQVPPRREPGPSQSD